MRILIADDHELLLAGLRRTLAWHFPDAEVVEAKTGKDCLALASGAAWDVLILDINLPDRNGLDMLRDLQLAAPKLPVLILSANAERDFGLPALKAGAFGYLSKSAGLEEVVEAVRKALAGKRYVSSLLAEKLVRGLGGPDGGPAHEQLSAREFQVLVLLGSGKTVTEVGAQLSLSVKTVSTYRTRLLEKMQLSSTAELMRYALVHGLTE